MPAAVTAQAQNSVIIRGRVVDPAGHAVESAQITITPGAHRAMSFDNGEFDVPGLNAGVYSVTARRIGYQSTTVSVLAKDSITRVTVTLVPVPRELDSVRIREKVSGLRYSALVLDQNDQPVTDAEVVPVGTTGHLKTDSLGRFSVPGLSRGTLIVQIRKMGYAKYFNSLRMLAERTDTIYMARLPQTMTAVQINELSGFGMDYWAQRDLQQRQSWKSPMSGAISREELAQHGKEDLCDALPGTASGNRLSIHNDPYCKSYPRGVRTILVDGVRCEHELLSDFAADEVELVEFISGSGGGFRDPRGRRGAPGAADLSGSLVARDCNAPAPVYVIWTRKSPDVHVQLAAVDSMVLRRDTTRSIAGTVFDSIAQRPLARAHVHIADLDRDTVTDSLGTFRFDSVGAGVHGVWVDHPELDSLGLYSLGERVDATPFGVSRVALAIPSFATLWKLACGTAPVPGDDSGFVFGHVHGDDSAVVGPTTAVDMDWRAIAANSAVQAGAIVKRDTRPDSTGSYAVCGVPAGRTVTMWVHDSVAAGVRVTFENANGRVTRRDLTLPSGTHFEHLLADSSVVAPNATGGSVVAASIRDSTGRALPDARMSISGVTGEWRTNASGTLAARGIPPGERVVTITGIGFERERRLMDLAPGDSASVDVEMTRLITRLSTMTITERRHFDAVRADIDHRAKIGFGYRIDSTALTRLPGLGEALNLPSVHVRFRGSQWSIYMTAAGAYSIPQKGSAGLSMDCSPTIWIDGFLADAVEANSLTKDEIGLVEVFTSAASAPMDYAGSRSNCGVVLFWRKRYISP
jgi:hypothetical protein